MKKTLIAAAVFAATGALYGIENVKILTTLPDNRVITKEVKAEKIAPNTTRITIPKDQIDPQCKFVDVIADNATAKKGDAGFWILNRGVLGYFNKDNYSYASSKAYMYLPYYAMKTPKETFIAVIDGMRFECDVRAEAKEGAGDLAPIYYEFFPRFYLTKEKIGFDPYEDIVITYYKLPLKADYNEMAKVYRRHKEKLLPKLKPYCLYCP